MLDTGSEASTSELSPLFEEKGLDRELKLSGRLLVEPLDRSKVLELADP